MDWNTGITAGYYAAYVDPATWRATERFEIIGGSISNSAEDLRSNASLDCKGYPQGTERWIRVYLDARQDDEAEHIAMFTGLATSPALEVNGRIISNTVDCYSVLKPAQDVLLDRGWYAPADADGGNVIEQLLSVTPAPVVVDDNAPTLTNAIIAEDGENNLSMVDKVLTAIGWRLTLDGDGTIHITPKAEEASASYDALENDAVEPKISVTRDWYGCPNVFRAVNDDLSGVARDDAEDSPLSTVNRGREVWAEETSCDLNNDETIAEYAARRLKEKQQVGTSAKYDRRYNPDLNVTDLIRLHYPGQGLDGLYEIVSQSIELGYGAKTSEEVVYSDR